jgi:sugar (pentulose or hexulose) kinase
MVSNVDVDGEPVASTLTMTGREYAIIAGDAAASDDEALAAVAPLLERATLALPSFVEDEGAFPGLSNGGRIIGPPPDMPAERRGLAALYAAFYADHCLTALGAGRRVIVDGGFATNLAFCRLLAALRPEGEVLVSRSRDGTALGAALLWRRFERRTPVESVALDLAAPYAVLGLAAAARNWVRLSASASP